MSFQKQVVAAQDRLVAEGSAHGIHSPREAAARLARSCREQMVAASSAKWPLLRRWWPETDHLKNRISACVRQGSPLPGQQLTPSEMYCRIG